MTYKPTPILIAADIVVFRHDIAEGSDPAADREVILFIRRKNEPWKGMLALPGGFVEPGKTIAQTAKAELEEETGLALHSARFNRIGVYDDPNRDPRGRVITFGHYVVVAYNTQAKAGDDAAAVEWLTFGEALKIGIAADHEQIIFDAIRARQEVIKWL